MRRSWAKANRRLAVMLAAVGLPSGLGGLVLVSRGGIRHPWLLALLLALSLVSYAAEFVAGPAGWIDAGIVIEFVGLVFVGPAACFLVVATPELLGQFTGRRIRPIALAANQASFAWKALAGSAALAASDDWPSPWGYFAATLLMAVVQLAVTDGIVECWDGWPRTWRIRAGRLGVAALLAPIAALAVVVGQAVDPISALVLLVLAALLPKILTHKFSAAPSIETVADGPPDLRLITSDLAEPDPPTGERVLREETLRAAARLTSRLADLPPGDPARRRVAELAARLRNLWA